MSVVALPQTQIGERVVEDERLEKQLDARQSAKERAGAAGKAYREADTVVRATLDELGVGEQPVRVGRFVISKSDVAARSVSFDTDPTSRLNIRVDKPA